MAAAPRRCCNSLIINDLQTKCTKPHLFSCFFRGTCYTTGMKDKESKFRWVEVLEDDCSWEYLEVLVDGVWRMAWPMFGTEDEKEIEKKLK